jgi:2-polyprenyl-3-methyl-5-hydroxy-6-metoxy-1,4-benzoquinol methylase
MESTPAVASNARCKFCGSKSALLHDALTDRLVGTTGSWRMLRCTNQACGLAWLDPAPTGAQLSAAYADYYTHASAENSSRLRRQYERLKTGYLVHQFGYDAPTIKPWEIFGGRLLACLPHRRAAFDASVMWLPATPGGKVLEIGCGNGNLLNHLATLGWQVQGVEPDRKAAEIATHRNLPVMCGELSEHSFAPQSFDAIIMSHVIEHIGDPITLLKICRQLLKPGGRLIILTPNLHALGHRWFGRDWLHLDPPRHLNLFTQESMATACRMSGFLNNSCKTTIRDANWTLGGSLALSRNGRYRIGELSWQMRAAGLAMLYVEWILVFLDGSKAEELLIIAHNPAR